MLWMALMAVMAAAPASVTPIDLAHHFEGFGGCFALLDTGDGSWSAYNPDQCRKRLSPCSTFKIPNSLISLDAGAVKDETEVLPWDGKVRSRETWNRDHDMISAMSHSVVWFYQELARRVGDERMQAGLDAMDYGNRDMSGGLTQFWLGSSLEISAFEQVAFLDRLRRGDLPVSARSMEIVKRILPESRGGRCDIRGKTGSGLTRSDGSLGWFVGFATCGEKSLVFATSIVAEDGASGFVARDISKAILEEMFP